MGALARRRSLRVRNIGCQYSVAGFCHEDGQLITARTTENLGTDTAFNACLTRKIAKWGRLLLSLLLFQTKKLKVTESSNRAWPTQWLSDRRINCGGGGISYPLGRVSPSVSLFMQPRLVCGCLSPAPGRVGCPPARDCRPSAQPDARPSRP